jgi:hypothetical protein
MCLIFFSSKFFKETFSFYLSYLTGARVRFNCHCLKDSSNECWILLFSKLLTFKSNNGGLLSNAVFVFRAEFTYCTQSKTLTGNSSQPYEELLHRISFKSSECTTFSLFYVLIQGTEMANGIVPTNQNDLSYPYPLTLQNRNCSDQSEWFSFHIRTHWRCKIEIVLTN